MQEQGGPKPPHDEKGANAAMQTLYRDHENGVVYRTMGVSDCKEAVRVLGNAFHNGEPTTLLNGCTLRDQLAFCALFVPRMAREGLSVLACDASSGQVIGGFLNEDFANEDPEGIEQFLAASDGDWGPTLAAVNRLEKELSSLYHVPLVVKERRWGHALHLWMIGVAKEGRGRGVAKNLARLSVELARDKGFKLAFAECTGAASTRILSKHAGCKLAYFLDYNTWSKGAFAPLVAQGHLGMSLAVATFQACRRNDASA